MSVWKGMHSCYCCWTRYIYSHTHTYITYLVKIMNLQQIYTQIEYFYKQGCQISKIPVKKIYSRSEITTEINFLSSTKPVLQNILQLLCSTKISKNRTTEFKKYLINRRRASNILNELNCRLFNLGEQLEVLNIQVLESKFEDVKSEIIDSQCSICLGDIGVSETCTRLKNICRHEFHRECLKTWITQRSLSCPVCRAEIKL